MAQIAGIATINIDGKELAVDNAAKMNPGGISRKPERHGGRNYFKEEETPASLEVSVLLTPDIDVIALSSYTNVTAQFKADTGQKYVLRAGYTEDPVEFDTSGGKTQLKLFFESCDLM